MIITTSIILQLIADRIIDAATDSIKEAGKEFVTKEILEPVKDKFLDYMDDDKYVYQIDPEYLSDLALSMQERNVTDFSIDVDEDKMIVVVNDPNISFFEMDMGIKGVPFIRIDKSLFD